MSIRSDAARPILEGEQISTTAHDLESEPPADFDSLGVQDYQSLLLHCAAVKLLQQEPALADRALATLTSFRKSTDPRSQALLDEWQDILTRRDWLRAVARDAQTIQLRQASPLPSVLPPDVREAVLATVRTLRHERWQAENKDALESSNQYVQAQGLPIRPAVPPKGPVEAQLLADVEAVLRDGETVLEFIESAVQDAIAMRRCLEDFRVRGEAAWQEYQRTGVSRAVDDVLAELRAMTERRGNPLGR